MRPHDPGPLPSDRKLIIELRNIALSDLKIATVNVRHSRKLPDVSDILPSIRARGVLQPPAGPVSR